MKKTYLWKAIVLFASVLAIGCNKEQNLPEEQTPNEGELKMVTETISAVADEGSTKVQIAESGAAFSWSEADKVAVHATTGETKWYLSEGLSDTYQGKTSATFTVTHSGDRDAFAIFPYTLVYDTSAGDYYDNSKSADGSGSNDLTINLPSSYALADVSGDKAPCPMIATNTGSGWTFKHLCGLLRLTVNSIPPSATKLTINFGGKKVNGAFTIANGSLDPGEDDCIIELEGSGNDVITINFAADRFWRDNVALNIPLPVGEYEKVAVTAYNGDTPLLSMTRPVLTSGNYGASRAHRKKLTASLPAFSVDASHRVAFAPGNLYWDGSAWQFHSEQYGTTFGTYTNPLQPTGGDNTAARRTAFLATHNRDLFQWTEMTGGVSGQSINFGTINGYNDWKVGDDYSYVIGSGLASRSGYRFVKMVLPFSKGFPDHTKTFASDETPAVMWGGTPGVFIFPDYWDGDLLTSFMKQKFSNTTPAQYRYNNISAHFESNASTETALDNDMTMEKYQQLIMAGAIFLPASGRVNASCNFVLGSSSTNTSKIFCDGGMWTCTAGTSSAITSNGAYIAFFHNDGFSMNAVLSQSQYQPVRLVRDLN